MNSCSRRCMRAALIPAPGALLGAARQMCRALCLAACLIGLGHWSAVAAQAASSAHSPARGMGADSMAWRSLSAGQRQALAPLANLWPELPASSREKWLKMCERFDRLSPQERERLQERMSQWAALPPSQRSDARLRFQQSRQLPPDERQQKWAAYQALPSSDREDLSRQARRRAKPVWLPDHATGPREAAQAYATKRKAAPTLAKSNVTPNTVTSSVLRPKAVSPSLVQAGAGATTNLVTRAPQPPMHQQVGLPKISASRDFVDPVTLLPRAGAQGAAMASLPAASASRP